MTFGLKYNYIKGFRRNSSEFANLLQFQPVIPFEAFGVPNILRITATGTIDRPGGFGFNDVAVFNLFVINERWGRWGFRPVKPNSPTIGETTNGSIYPSGWPSTKSHKSTGNRGS